MHLNLLYETSLPKVKWVAPRLEDERQEIYHYAGSIAPTNVLLQIFQNGKLIVLDDKTWSQLENTDSWQILSIPDVISKAKEYHKNEKDVNVIINTIRNGGNMSSPTVLFRNAYPPFLIGGNTRLMVAKAMGVRPKIWAIKLPGQ